MHLPHGATTMRVTRDYTASTSDPLSATQGESVMPIGEIDLWDGNPSWGWLKCRDARGRVSWVATNYLLMADTGATLTRDYDARELTAPVGAVVTILAEESGWFWCQMADGATGWLPNSHLEALPHQP